MGTINNSTPRTVTIPLDFLPPGNYQTEIYKDASDPVNHPDKLIKESHEVHSSGKLVFDLPAGGGVVMKITEK